MRTAQHDPGTVAMNTANLQLEGVYAAMAALVSLLREKGLLNADEIETALRAAEEAVEADPRRPTELSAEHVDAIRFPLRILRLANRPAQGGPELSFDELATRVGRPHPDHCPQ